MTVTSRFQSTPSGGKATSPICVITPERAFQSTPSGGKATLFFLAYLYDQPVSIHAFRGEGDSFSPSVQRAYTAFQSTPSGGKATAISRVAMPCFRQIL